MLYLIVMFVALLWGIEMYNHGELKEGENLFVALLWGIEITVCKVKYCFF